MGGSRSARIAFDSGYLRDFLTTTNATDIGAVVGGVTGFVISATGAALVFSFCADRGQHQRSGALLHGPTQKRGHDQPRCQSQAVGVVGGLRRLLDNSLTCSGIVKPQYCTARSTAGLHGMDRLDDAGYCHNSGLPARWLFCAPNPIIAAP